MGTTQKDAKPAPVTESLQFLDGWRHVTTLRRWARNEEFKTIAAQDVSDIAGLILRVGFVAPIIVGRWPGLDADRMVAGHTRLSAMELLIAADPSFAARGAPGPGMVRVVRHDFASESEADEYAIADNRLQRTKWREENLAPFLQSVDVDTWAILGFRETDDDVKRMLAAADRGGEVAEVVPGQRSRQQPTIANGQWDVDGFNAAAIKQVVLMLSAEQFDRAIPQLERVMQDQKLESNTDAVLFLLSRYQELGGLP